MIFSSFFLKGVIFLERIRSYVLNDFLKFDRKVYGLAKKNWGRPIKFKSILYWLFFNVVFIIWYFIPVLNLVLRWLPPIIVFMIPALISYLLTAVGTEGRAPVSYFRSYVSYNLRKAKAVTYYRGKELEKAKTYRFNPLLSIGSEKKEKEKQKIISMRGYVSYSSKEETK